MLNIQFLVLVELFDAFLEECLFHSIMSMGVEKNRSAMLAVPHQDGIVHQAELVCLSIKGIGNLPVVSDLLKEPLIAIVGQVIVVTAKQTFNWATSASSALFLPRMAISPRI